MAALVAAVTAPASGEVITLALPPASVKLMDCSREARSAAFYGRVRQIDGSTRMWMRFTLLEKGTEGFHPVSAPELARWLKSKPGVGSFGYRQTVRGLAQGALYKMQVNYRWYSKSGRLLAKARRRSKPCRQFEALPNLTAKVLGARLTKFEGVLRYSVRVRNTGVAPVSALDVQLSVDGDVVETVSVGTLRAGESKPISVRGPACTASVSAAADPDGVLVESSELDNVDTVACADLPRS